MDTHPVCNVLGVSESRRQSNESDVITGLFWNISHATNDDLDNWTSLLSEQMDLIDNHKCHCRNIGSALPISRNTVPLLGGSDEDISSLQSLQVRSDITRQLKYGLLKATLLESLLPVNDPFFCQGFQRSDENNLSFRGVLEHSQHGQFRHDGFTRTCWGAD